MRREENNGLAENMTRGPCPGGCGRTRYAFKNLRGWTQFCVDCEAERIHLEKKRRAPTREEAAAKRSAQGELFTAGAGKGRAA